MGSEPPAPNSTDAPPPVFVVTDAAKAKARKFFEHAKKAADTRNWDYAIKLYVDGLALWPDAVEEGLKPLRVVATARRLDGGKPMGFLTARGHQTATKDVMKNLAGALMLFGHDPASAGPQEAILKNASKARLIRTVAWIAPVLVDTYNSTKKLSESHYKEACEAMDAAADFAMGLAEDKLAMDILNANISTAQIWAAHHETSTDAPRARAHASGKLTIVKGKFDKADGFEQSLKDAEATREMLDLDKAVLTEDRAAKLIAKARAEWEAHPDVPAKLLELVDLMVRDETESREQEAIALLEKEYEARGNYALKVRADDLRIKQMNRRRRELERQLRETPSDVALQQRVSTHRAEQNQREIDILLDRQRQYPTDLRIKFLLGVRYLNAKRYDEAIPLFQLSQADGRTRAEARFYMGRCFYEKKFLPQAIETFRSTRDEIDATAGPILLECNYWLGRALQEAGQREEARKVYGQLIQLDYNYKDARQRYEALVSDGTP